MESSTSTHVSATTWRYGPRIVAPQHILYFRVMALTIRAATTSDAPRMGLIHVNAWRDAYGGGLMPEAYLARMSPDDRAKMWKRSIDDLPRPRRALLVAEAESRSVVGFIAVGPEANDDSANVGELYSINVDPPAWSTGAGFALHQAGLRALRDAGFVRAVLWVHPCNERAIAFYERRGWQHDAIRRVATVIDVEVPEVRLSTDLGH